MDKESNISRILREFRKRSTVNKIPLPMKFREILNSNKIHLQKNNQMMSKPGTITFQKEFQKIPNPNKKFLWLPQEQHQVVLVQTMSFKNRTHSNPRRAAAWASSLSQNRNSKCMKVRPNQYWHLNNCKAVYTSIEIFTISNFCLRITTRAYSIPKPNNLICPWSILSPNYNQLLKSIGLKVNRATKLNHLKAK